MTQIRLDHKIKKYQWKRNRAADGLKEQLLPCSRLVTCFLKWIPLQGPHKEWAIDRNMLGIFLVLRGK